jgi:uncharacterized membrane protein SpoIIM required for sporulation
MALTLPFLRKAEIEAPPDVAAASLRSDRFRLQREGEWKRLDRIVECLEKGRIRRISDADLLALPELYRQAASSLAVARETSLDAAALGYLESLVRRAWFQVYGPRTSFRSWLRRFVLGDWARAVRSIWQEIAIALGVMIAGTLAGWLLVARNSQWYYALIPEGMAEGREPGASRTVLARTLEGTQNGQGLSMLATFLFSHNSAVAIMAFGLGFAFGIPSLLLLIYTAASLGAMLWLFASAGLGWEFAAWISIHGTTELSAITLAGAAGLHIGRTMAFPGERSVLAAASASGKRAAQVMAGVVLMLAVAGLLEGYARQLLPSPITRALVGGAMLLAWVTYFTLGGRRRGTAR